jgi:hypothetical protein
VAYVYHVAASSAINNVARNENMVAHIAQHHRNGGAMRRNNQRSLA